MTRSLAVRYYMVKDLVTFKPDTEIMHAIQTLVDKKISGAPVVDSRGNLIGLLSEKDCMRVALNTNYHGGAGGMVEEFMSRQVQVVEADHSLVEVIEQFEKLPYRRFPVVENNRLVGQISRRDVLRALLEFGDQLRPWSGK